MTQHPVAVAPVNPALGTWFERRTFTQPETDVDALIAAKDGRSVSVVLPALNEEETVGAVVSSIMPYVGELVDEIIVVDSGSTDKTVEFARSAGATVVTREEALPGFEPLPGKGEVLWRSLAVATGDVIAFVDSDLIDPDPAYVPRLISPMLTDRSIQLVKAYYRRPLKVGENIDPAGGGRVTELVARPLLTALYPELSDVLQPLSGEYAATRELLMKLAFPVEYGVEIAILIDTYRMLGVEAIAQVDLRYREHRNRPLHELAPMSRQIMAAMFNRCDAGDSGVGLSQFIPQSDGGFERVVSNISVTERPPMANILGELDEMAS